MRGPRAQRTREGEGGEGADGGKDNYLRCWSISQTDGGRRQSAATRALALTDMWREILDFCCSECSMHGRREGHSERGRTNHCDRKRGKTPPQTA